MFVEDEEVSVTVAAPIDELNLRCGSRSGNVNPGDSMLNLRRMPAVTDDCFESVSVEVVKLATYRSDNVGVIKKAVRAKLPSPGLAASM